LLKKKRKRGYGEKFTTPSLKEQKLIDPENYRTNMNFLPIDEKSNKLLKRKNKSIDIIKALDNLGEDEGDDEKNFLNKAFQV
jgi:hypothetical protein